MNYDQLSAIGATVILGVLAAILLGYENVAAAVAIVGALASGYGMIKMARENRQ